MTYKPKIGRPKKKPVDPNALPRRSSVDLAAENPFTIDRMVSIRELVDRYCSWCIANVHGDHHEAARLLGVTTRTICNRMKQFNKLED